MFFSFFIMYFNQTIKINRYILIAAMFSRARREKACSLNLALQAGSVCDRMVERYDLRRAETGD